MKVNRKRLAIGAGTAVLVGAVATPLLLAGPAGALNAQPQVYFASVAVTGTTATLTRVFPPGTTVFRLDVGDYRIKLPAGNLTAGCVSTANTNADLPQAATAQSSPPGFPTGILVHTFGTNNQPQDAGFDLITVC